MASIPDAFVIMGQLVLVVSNLCHCRLSLGGPTLLPRMCRELADLMTGCGAIICATGGGAVTPFDGRAKKVDNQVGHHTLFECLDLNQTCQLASMPRIACLQCTVVMTVHAFVMTGSSR